MDTHMCVPKWTLGTPRRACGKLRRQFQPLRSMSCELLPSDSPVALLLSETVPRGARNLPRCNVILSGWLVSSLLSPPQIIPDLIVLLAPILVVCLGEHVVYVFEGSVAGISLVK